MIFPQGEILHANLFTSYLNINELMSNLAADEFTGYIEVKFWDYQGFIFFDQGNSINALEEVGGSTITSRKTGKQAQTSILAKSKEKDGEVSVHMLDNEKLITIASVVNRKLLHEDLTTDYVKLEKFIEKLVEEEPSGYIEITIGDSRGMGVVFFGDGEISDAIFDEKGTKCYGEEAIDKMLDLCEAERAVFNVYKTDIMATSSTVTSEPASPDFFDQFEQNLTTIMGPMAAIIVDEAIENMGEVRDSFPKSRIVELIEKVSNEIGDPGQQSSFIQGAKAIPC